MRTRRYELLGCLSLAAWLVLAFASASAAQTVRAVLLSKQVTEGKSAPESGLEAAASAALQQAGLRIVELESALRAQRHALSDQVRAGHVPNELSVLNADVIVSLQLRCSQSSDRVLQTKLRGEYCVLDSKVVGASSGDVLFSQSRPFTGYGLNSEMAVQSLLDSRIPGALTEQSRTWMASLTQAATWEVDLTVARISDRETGRALAKQVGQLPGVQGVRLVAYDRNLAKYSVAGRGQAELEGLAGAIENDPKLSLAVTYETARTLHAEFSLVKAYKRRVMAMSIVPLDSELQPVAAEVLRSALINLPYLEMAHTLPLCASPEEARALEVRLRDKAKSLGVPLIIAASFAPDAQGWLSALKLIESESGRTLAAASASGETSTQAIDAAVHAFDASFRVALGQPAVRARLGLRDLSTQLANDPRLVVQAFNLPGHKSGTHAGSLSIRNDSNDTVSSAELKVHGVHGEVYARQLPDLAPHAATTVPLAFELAPLAGAERLTATISYPRDRTYARVVAVAPRLVRDVVRASPTPEGYAELHAAAVKQRDAGQWQEARTLFERSDRLFSNAQALRELGMVELDLGEYDAAQRHFDAALNAKTLALDATQRSDVSLLLTRARVRSSGRQDVSDL